MHDPSGRRYSEREFALILRKASELQADGERPGRVDGLSLDQIRDVAAEAGIDPELVTRAAALVGHGDVGASRRITGPSSRLHMSASTEGELDEDDMRRLMEIVRHRTSRTGTIEQVLGSVAWKSDEAENPVEVRVTPGDGRTTLEVLSRAEAVKVLVYAAGGVAGFMGSLILFKETGLATGGPLLGLSVAAAGAVSLLGSRPIWSWWARRWRDRLSRLLDDLRVEAEQRLLSD